MFQVGEKIVYPGHGIGEIVSIESRTISGTSQDFYILRIVDSDMKVMVPVANSHSVV